jgi:hypothetical protein
MTVLLTATMDLIGLLAGCSLAPVPGSTALAGFTATSTTALIHTTVTTDRCRSAVRSGSTTSTATRRATGEATQATLAMTPAANTLCRDTMAVATPRLTARDTIAQLEENVHLAREFTPLSDGQASELVAKAEPVAKPSLFFQFYDRP